LGKNADEFAGISHDEGTAVELAEVVVGCVDVGPMGLLI
jgi:hypothetical protein